MDAINLNTFWFWTLTVSGGCCYALGLIRLLSAHTSVNWDVLVADGLLTIIGITLIALGGIYYGGI